MTIQLLVNIAADNPQIVSGLGNALHEDIHALASDALHSAFEKGPFKIKSDVVALRPGMGLGAQTQTVLQLIQNLPLLTKADAARRCGVTVRTLERWRRENKFPRPVRVKGGPRWRPEDIAQFEANENPTGGTDRRRVQLPLAPGRRSQIDHHGRRA